MLYKCLLVHAVVILIIRVRTCLCGIVGNGGHGIIEFQKWKLLSLQTLDSGAGRYTQARTSTKTLLLHNDTSTRSVVVWNAVTPVPGLRMTQCSINGPHFSSDALNCSKVRSIPKVDQNPRFIRLELADFSNNSSVHPLMLHTAEEDGALVLTVCSRRDVGTAMLLCRSGEGHEIEQITLLSHQDKILYFDLQFIEGMNNKNYKKDDDKIVQIAATVSNNQHGCKLMTFLVSLKVPLQILHQETVRRVTEPFHIDETTALPVTGLDNPVVARGSLLYWDISHRRLVLLFRQQRQPGTQYSSWVVAGNTSNTTAADNRFYNPGAWARMVSVDDNDSTTIVVTFFDLEQHSLFVTQCYPQGQQYCDPPQLVDATAYRGDFTDFGAGAFPDLQLNPYCQSSVDGNIKAGGCPVLVYFVDKKSATNTTSGCLRVMICQDPHCQQTRVFDATCGLAGYGRDASVTFTAPGSMALVSFLDLQGRDDPVYMQAKLALFELGKERVEAFKR